MTEKLRFIPVEDHVVLEYINKKSKLTERQKADIALRVIANTNWEVVKTYFVPICEELLINMQEDYRNKNKPVNDDLPTEPQLA
jgi:hypothetical protein